MGGALLGPVGPIPHPRVGEKAGGLPAEQDHLAVRRIVGHGVVITRGRAVHRVLLDPGGPVPHPRIGESARPSE